MMFAINLMFLSLFLGFFGAKLWCYTHDLSWMDHDLVSGKPLLPLSNKLAIFELATDFLSDAILIGLPLRLLWRIKLPKRQRRMILTIFASGIVVTFASCFRGSFQILNMSFLVMVGMDAEIGFSMIICNLLVFVTFIYRYGCATTPSQSERSRSDDDEDDDYTTPMQYPRRTLLLTTIELDGMSCSSGNPVTARREVRDR
ncbi:hypothetical protein ID866_9623 [Astraeus odoratus]|nr:hypothetical protein ID866_9623 [Astraeus odoratus]